jgi:hypothetical protein
VTDYRIVARHVRYWRGAVHKWSTVWPFTGTLSAANYSTALLKIHDLEQAVNWGNAAIDGGLFETALYDQAVGGIPVAVQTYFDWTVPGAWIAYTPAIGWSVVPASQLAPAEVAILAEWKAGLSVRGKPVMFRKWFHSAPTPTLVPPAADITPANVTALQAVMTNNLGAIAALGAPMGRGGRLAAAQTIVRPFYGNHQMPRGRRRKALVSASGQYNGPSVQIPGPIELA